MNIKWILPALSILLSSCTNTLTVPDITMEKIPDDIRAQQVKDMEFGMFICWSFSTFSGHEWTPTLDKDASYFKATGCDTDQWCETAKAAGMNYILFLSKHHDGFCLWDTATTDKKVTNSSLGIDVLAKLRKSCDKYGIKLALYFSEGDWNWPGAVDGKNGKAGAGINPEMKKAQLKELLTNYGPIEFWWIDHAVGTGGVDHKETVEWVHKFQPNSFVGFNHGEPGGRLCLRERGRPGKLGDANATRYNKEAEGSYEGYLAAEFTYPILPEHKGGAHWFYSLPKHDKLCHPAEKLYADYLGAKKYGNIFSIDVGPNYQGRLRDVDVKTLKKVGQYIRGEIKLPKGPVSRNKPARASTEWNHDYTAESAFDGNPHTRWGAVEGSRSGWLEVDLGNAVSIRRVVINEGNWDRVRKFEILAKKDNKWETVISRTKIVKAELTFEPVSARYFRLNILEANEVPTILEFELFSDSNGSSASNAAAKKAAPASIYAAEVSPEQLEFRRQAVRRMIFDRSQDIRLCGLWPAKVVGLDVMHPPVGEQVNDPWVAIEDGRLRISAKKQATATRWVGGFNPFASYDVTVNKFNGSGEIGLMFRDTDAENRITATLVVKKGIYRSIRCVVVKDGKEVERQDFTLPKALIGNDSICLRVQMLAVGVNLFVEQDESSTLIGRMDFVKHFDLRRKNLMRRFEFCLHSSLDANSSVEIDEATAALSPGIGQSDIRVVTYEDGSPLFKDGRLWILMTVRGGALPHPMQGIYSLNPSVFDIRFEGIILYDRGDGLLRNDLASNIFYDRNQKEWRGFTTGFSAYGDPEKKEKKQIWAVQSSREPLEGLSIMKAKPIGLVGMHEDPQCIYDSKAGKWRMLLCESHKGFKAVMRESDKWDGPYEKIAGPVEVNSTGTQLQKIGQEYYALFGSADRKVHIYTYPDLKPAGELRIHRPPWNDKTGTRIWPNVIPLPEGYPARYIALMMDRLNFPGMKGANWTYGAMYLYHAHPAGGDQLDYEYKSSQTGN